MGRVNFQSHNFKENFLAAHQFQDAGLKNDILMDELASLIARQPKDVISAMETMGIKYTGKTYGDLSNATFDLMAENEKFAAMMGSLIAYKHGLIAKEQITGEYHSDAGKVMDEIGGVLTGGNIITKIIHAVVGQFSSDVKKREAKKMAEITAENQKQLDIVKEQTREDLQNEKKNNCSYSWYRARSVQPERFNQIIPVPSGSSGC